MLQIRILSDEAYAIDSLSRFRRQRHRRKRIVIPGLFGLLFILPITVLLFRWREYGMAIPLTGFFFVVIFSGAWESWTLRRKIRNSPFNNDELTFTLTEDAFGIASDRGEANLNWTAFTEVMHFDDGFLLFQGPLNFNWLPLSAFTQGTAKEMDNLLRQKISKHRSIR